jgi:hypothetical protein
MARQIIVLERTPASFGAITVTVVFWLPVTAGQEAPRPGFVSSVKGADEPTPAELAALQAGQVYELVSSWRFPDSYSMAQSRAFLEAAYAAALADFVPPGQLYGMNWNGTAWAN